MQIKMFSVHVLHKKMFPFVLSNIQKSILRSNICISQVFYSQLTFIQRTDPCLNRPHLCNLTNIRRMAGHSKWQNIKHVKAAKDREKNITTNKFSFLIRKLAQEGGKDPKFNHKLASTIELAKKSNVTVATIENALKSDNKKTKSGSIELLGPGGSMLVIEYETDNVSTIRHDVKLACKKSGAHVMSGEGRWRAVFEQKGIIKALDRKDGQTINEENALDDAILAGAEEVLTKEDGNNKFYLEFLCSPNDLNQVKKEIEGNYEVEEGYIGYLPIVSVKLNDTDMASFETLLDDLGCLSDVIRIYENVQ